MRFHNIKVKLDLKQNQYDKKLYMISTKDSTGKEIVFGILKHKYNPDADIDTFWTTFKREQITIDNTTKYTPWSENTRNPFSYENYRNNTWDDRYKGSIESFDMDLSDRDTGKPLDVYYKMSEFKSAPIRAMFSASYGKWPIMIRWDGTVQYIYQ